MPTRGIHKQLLCKKMESKTPLLLVKFQKWTKLSSEFITL